MLKIRIQLEAEKIGKVGISGFILHFVLLCALPIPLDSQTSAHMELLHGCTQSVKFVFINHNNWVESGMQIFQALFVLGTVGRWHRLFLHPISLCLLPNFLYLTSLCLSLLSSFLLLHIRCSLPLCGFSNIWAESGHLSSSTLFHHTFLFSLSNNYTVLDVPRSHIHFSSVIFLPLLPSPLPSFPLP